MAEVGKLVGKLHSIEAKTGNINPTDWYTKWFSVVKYNLQLLGIYTEPELDTIEKAVLPVLIDKFLPPKFTVVHRDLLQKNIFVDPVSKAVTSIIDWETTKLGNP